MTVAFQWQFGSGVPPATVVNPTAADPVEGMSTMDEQGRGGPDAPNCSGDRCDSRVNLDGAAQVSGVASVFGSRLVSLTAIVGKLDLALAGGSGRGDTRAEPLVCILPCGIGN